jgi:Fic family protein
LYNFVKKKKELDKDTIFALHKIILNNINDIDGGHYRTSNVMIIGAIHIPPSAIKINRLMGELFEWYYRNKSKLSVAELAAWAHYKIVHIHPFIDGNGRTARLLMNLILIQNGYPPAVILNVDRQKYYRVLKEADREKYDGFINFIGRSIERSLLIYLNALKSKNYSENKYGYISLQEAAQLCGYGIEYLCYLARTGKLQAIKIWRNWMTTREEILDYTGRIKK